MTKELLQQVTSMIDRVGNAYFIGWTTAEIQAIKDLRALAQQEQPAQEAVVYELEAVKFANGKKLLYQKPKNLASYIKVRTLVYADADPAPTQPALSDEEILAMNAGEVFFSESPSKYPEAGHGTQYHAGAPGVLKFARAIEAHCRGGATS